MATVTITVQRTSSAYAMAVPAHAWHDAGTATTARGLERVYQREYRATHPQPNAYSGHIRCTVNGEPVDYGTAYRMLGGDVMRLPARYW